MKTEFNLPMKAEKKIIRIEDHSTEQMKRARVFFANGLQLSIIQGKFSYGGDRGLYEIAPINTKGDLDGGLLQIEENDVLGYLTKEDVQRYICIMAEKGTK